MTWISKQKHRQPNTSIRYTLTGSCYDNQTCIRKNKLKKPNQTNKHMSKWTSIYHTVYWRKRSSCFCLLNTPATQCTSKMDLSTQLHVLPHWERSCKENLPSPQSPSPQTMGLPDLTLTLTPGAWFGSHMSTSVKLLLLLRSRPC